MYSVETTYILCVHEESKWVPVLKPTHDWKLPTGVKAFMSNNFDWTVQPAG